MTLEDVTFNRLLEVCEAVAAFGADGAFGSDTKVAKLGCGFVCVVACYVSCCVVCIMRCSVSYAVACYAYRCVPCWLVVCCRYFNLSLYICIYIYIYTYAYI